ncbi:MAG: hypothetical protein P8Y22_01280 [Sulfurimonas sp.]
MKQIVLIFIFLGSLLPAQEIINNTTEPMICKANYPAIYETEIIHNIEQRVMVQKQDDFVMKLNSNKSYQTTRSGNVVCFNSIEKISTYNNNLRTETGKRYEYFKKEHEAFDIALYENENRNFVEAKFGIHRTCVPYKGGQYCQVKNGLDILYTKEGRIKKLFIYGQGVYGLDFKPSSFSELKVNNNPLGLWIADKNKKLVQSKPSFQSSNAIVWNNPDKYIKSIVLIAKNGHLSVYRRRYMKQEQKTQEPKDQLEAVEVDYVLDDKAYALHQKSRPMPTNPTIPFRSHMDRTDLPKKAKSTWGEYLNPKNIIPVNKFKAFYIDTNNPKKVIASETVEKVAVNYPWKDFHNIDAKNFGAYWIGNFIFKKEKEQELSVSQSWAKTRIIIDGMVVYEGGSNKQFTHKFTKGKHKVEIEYVNNWHTVGFMFTMKNKEKLYSLSEMQKELQQKSSKNSVVVFAGAYESKRKDQTITLKIAKQTKPIVLVLDSYDAVRWQIQNPYKVKIEAIIFAAYKPGIEITGDGVQSVPKYHLKNRLGVYKMQRSCTCINGGADFHCEGRESLDILNSIESTTQKKVFGYSVGYALDTVIVPNTLITKQKIMEFKELQKQNELARKNCQKQSNPNFEKMFE